ncbi:unnamed protein product [Brachionus calyciflorus]|uniref:DNA-directed DNA polymerase n=1 Tax=Brachionus calyciflorus TaxID=104777 RepID=A0A813WVM1_9BILA|nr:unnamed protein product [Brachionus calyciflorus]
MINGAKLVEKWECDWNRSVKNDPEVGNFVKQCKIREQINPPDALFGGLRSVMKMLLNSFWGRFGMNTNKTQYKVISNPLEWFEMVCDDQYTIHIADFFHENYVQVFYSTNGEMHEGSSQNSVVLAAFVTCHGRLKLYEELKKIDKRVLYFNTDSIIDVRSPGQYRPILGDYLGDFTD